MNILVQEKCNHSARPSHGTLSLRQAVLLCFVAVTLTAGSAMANVTVTAATGGTAISADTTGSTYTKVTGPTIAEGAVGDVGAGNIVITAPSGFVFNTAVTPAAIVAGGGASKNINNTPSGSSFNASSVTTSAITFAISTVDTVVNTLTFTNIQVRPSAGTPLASGNMTTNGTTSSLKGMTGNNWGTLTEVAGAANKLVYGQQPTVAAVGATISPAITVKVQDQFGNATTSSATVALAFGTNPSGASLGGTTSVAASSGTATFNAVSINKSGTGYTLAASSTGLTGVTSSSFNITNGNTTTAVSSSANPSVVGQSVTFTATVTAVAPATGTPTGTVTFLDGATTLGTGTLSGGQATFTTNGLALGGHTITASYGGDSSFNTSSSSTVSQTVNQSGTTTAVSSSANPSVWGQSVTFTATVAAASPGSGTPTGTVTFKDGATTLGTGTLSAGQATFSTSSLSVTSHSITAIYGGDANYTTSTSSALTQAVNKAATTTSVSPSANPAVSGQSVTFTTTVNVTSPGAGAPSGTVTFKDGVTTLGTGTISGGQATFSTSSLSVASHSITAVYSGDGNFNTSTSSTLTEAVNRADTTTALASSQNPSVYGGSITFTATVNITSPGAGTVSGTITFKDGSTTLGTGSISGGQATFSTSSLSVGSHSITAIYGGDSNFNTSTSSALSQTVNMAAATVTVSSSVNPSIVNQSVSFSATIPAVGAGATPTGTVQFKVDGVNLGAAVTLAGGTAASQSIASLTQGDHNVSAEYSGDANYNATTNTLTQTVNAPYANCTASNNGPVCEGGTLQLFGTTTDTGAGVYYSWTGPNGFTSTNQNPTIANASATDAGTYWLTTGTTGTTNCIEMTVVSVAPALTVSVTADTVCTGSSGNITANANGGTAPYSYSWSPGGATSQTISVTDGGVYTVTVTDSTGTSHCSVQASGALTLKSLPVASIGGANSVCPNSTNIYSAPAGMDSYSWTVTGAASIEGAANAQTVSIVTAAGCNTNFSLSLAVGANGCSGGYSTNISVIDTTAPAITSVPADVTVSCANAVPTANDNAVVATDGCSAVTISHLADAVTSSNCPNNFTITRTYVATDACGNSSTQTQTITVHDTTGPVITAFPADATYSCSGAVPAADDTAVNATDACGGTLTVTHADDVVTPGSCANRYTIARTYTAADACGNVTSQTQHITVNDSTAPVLAGVPADVTVQCNAIPTAATPTASDNCDSNPTINFNETTAAGSCPGSYTITRTWTATDSCGNSSSGTQTITVVDTTAPVLAGVPSDITTQCDNIPSPANPTATDNCDSNPTISYNQTTAAGSCAGSSVLTRTWTATDACGNSSSTTQTITVIDTTAPVITGVPADATVQCDAVPVAATPTVTDTCDTNATITLNETTAAGSCSNSYVLTRTWTATDACGNSSSASQVITVIDTTAPVIAGVPADATVQCDAVPAAAAPTVTDTCDTNTTISFNETSAAGACANSYVLTRTWTASDACGNSSTATQTITVIDTTAPVLAGVPADATVQCNDVPPAATPTATDTCDSNPTISFNETSAAGSCPGSYVLTRVWTATDVCGNSSSATQTITVIDTTAPVLAGVPADATVQCDAVPAAATPTAADNCDNNPTISYTQTTAAGSCAGSFVLTRTWTATDACGNSSSATQTIHVIDTTAPVIAGVPADATVQCDAVPGAATPTVTDTCDTNATITLSETTVAGSCSNSYVLTRTWTATDVCGNSSSASQKIAVIDTTAPVIAGVPADVTVQCDAVPTAATPTVTDTCDAHPTISLNETSAAGACANSYVLTRTWTATDACGNTSSAKQTITVIDTTAPVIAGVPADATVQCNAVPPAATPSATDTCDGNPTISFSETSATGACAGSYVLTRTWTATDACGNSSSASQQITVIDTTAPVLAGVPSDATVQCDAVPAVATPTATDNCDSNPTIAYHETSAPGACSNSYVLTRVWTASDACGNSSSATQTITVIDTTAPVLAGVPTDVTVQCDAVPAAATPTATDNCDTNAAISFNETRAAGACANSYVLTRTWTATDACGNSSSATQKITVIDTTAPVIAGVPADATVQCDAVPAVATPSVTDSCDSNPTINFNETSAPGACANSYVLTRTWTATDACGNASSATQTITVIDTAAPVIAGVPADMTVQCDAVPTAATPTATDTCDTNATISLNETISSGAVVGQFVITRTWTATDGCGNTSSASQHITAIDTTAPVLAGVPADATVECNVVPAAATPTATDNCDPHPTVTFSETTAAGSCPGSYVLTRTWTATDASGNASSATQTITVHDTTAPTLTAVPADVTVQCDAVPVAGTPTVTDNCDTNATVSMVETRVNGSCTNSYTLTRTWTATDACGNSSTATQTITVIDTTAPVIAGVPADATVQCDAVPTAASPTVTDNCDSAATLSFNESTAAGSCVGSYVITRRWTATDACGNSSTATQKITVHDTTAPVIVGVPADVTAQCNAVPGAATPTATDNCDSNPSITLSETSAPGACPGSYVLTRSWTATDACGNTSTATQHVTVIDTTAPVLAGVPASTTAQCNSIPTAATPTATDNCDSNPTVTLHETTAAGSCAGSYVITRTWTATDACGNSSSASQTITVIDTTAPTITGVPASTTSQCGSVPTAATPTATDNCDSNPTISLNETTTPGSCAGSYTLTRTWTATDVCGNSSSATQTITVIDTTAPTLVGVPSSTTVQCDAVPTAASPTVTDNCDTNATIAFNETRANGSCSNSYVLTRTWTATDACGNSSSATQTITVIDTTAPVLAGVPADTTVQCSAVPSAATPTATDNCDSNPHVSLSETTTPGSSANNYTITRKWTATDTCGNTSSAQQVITVIDSTAPVLAGVPADMTATCSTIPTAATPSATDNCDTNITVSLSESSTQTATGCSHDSYTITRTWTATDSSGNTSTGVQKITVTPVAPVITGFPADATYTCASSVPAADDNLVTSGDACGAAVVISHDADVITGQTCANHYTVTRTYHATSACGMVVSRSQTITIDDSSAPTITSFPADASYTSTNQIPAPDDSLVIATDNCGAGVTVTHAADVTVSGADAHHHTVQRTYTATDACGNAISQTQTFTIDTSASVTIAITGSTDVVTNKPTWTFKGTAGGDNPISSVQYSLNGGAFTAASGTTSWTAALALQAGTNTFQVKAIDNQNNESSISNAVVFYATSNKLVVVIQDWPHKGNFSTATILPSDTVNKPKKVMVGKTYHLTAVPKTNRRFLGWYSSTDANATLYSTSTTYDYVFDPAKTLVARFEDPFYYIQGNYSGLFAEPTVDLSSSGYITISLPAVLDSIANKFSAKIILGGTKYSESLREGSFDSTGHAHFVVGTMTVDLYADLHSTFNGVITGTVANSSPAWVANLTAYRDINKKTQTLPPEARFTMALPPKSDSPNGYGYGAIHRSSAATVAVAGTLADGTAWLSQAGKPSPDGHWPLMADLYKKNAVHGLLWGWLQFTGDSQGVTGTLYWFRPSGVTATTGAGTVETYTAGITNNNITIIGSPYDSSKTSFSDWTKNGVVFLYDDSRRGVTNIVSKALLPVQDPTYNPTNKLVLRITSTTGIMGTSFQDPNDKKTDHIKGVVLQNQSMAAGLFYRANSGLFLLQQLP